MEGFTSKIWDNLLKGSSEFNNETPVYAGCASWFAESSKKVAQRLQRLRTGIVKLSGLTNLERTRTQDKHFL